MEIKHIYWLAGLLDGEGWFGYQSTPHINISQTDLDLVERAKSIFGKCPPIKTYFNENPKHKTKYVLTINGMLAVQWMMTIYPLMTVRRKSQIRDVIEKWKSSPNRSIGSDYCKRGHPLLVENVDFAWYQGPKNKNPIKTCKICARDAKRIRWNKDKEKSNAKQREYYHNKAKITDEEKFRQMCEKMGLDSNQLSEAAKKVKGTVQ